jgi:hypothetical protein
MSNNSSIVTFLQTITDRLAAEAEQAVDTGSGVIVYTKFQRDLFRIHARARTHTHTHTHRTVCRMYLRTWEFVGLP